METPASRGKPRVGLPSGRRPFVLVCCFAVLLARTAAVFAQQEFFVSPKGDDGADGLSAATALRSVQAGVARLGAGDTLTILPGEYMESVRADGLGSDRNETRIRAAIPRTVILRGDVPAPDFERVGGCQFVYRAGWPSLPTAVLEVDTLTALQRSLSVDELEFMAGHWYFDEDNRTLYISTSDLKPPGHHHYRIAMARESGLYLDNARRVRVEGLVATGFYPDSDRMHSFSRHVSGFMLNDATDSTIADCLAFLNGNGVCIVRGSGNTVEDSEAYGNYTNFHAPSGNIVVFEPNNSTARRNIAHTTRQGSGAGIKFYSTFHGPALLEENVVWGSQGGDIWTKGADANVHGLARRNTVLGDYAVHNKEFNLMGQRNQYRRDNPDPTTLVVRPDSDRELEFADPSHLDFRLQINSSFRGTAPDGKDPGPKPFAGDVFFVGPAGSDAADGQSLSSAWNSLDHALARLKPGQTLYLLAGEYAVSAGIQGLGSAAAPIHIRGRGMDRVTITTPVHLRSAQNLSWSRIHFANRLSLEDCATVTIENCVFSGGESGIAIQASRDVRILHNEFVNSAAAAVSLGGAASSGLFLAGNLFDRTIPVAFRAQALEPGTLGFSDYNGFGATDVAEIDGRRLPLSEWQQQFDLHSAALEPIRDGDPASRLQLAGLGPWGRPIGQHFLFSPQTVHLAGPFVHSVADRSANIEWFTSVPALCEVTWGTGAETVGSRGMFTKNFGALTITGLEPGTDYWFRVDSVDPGANPVAHDNFYLAELARIPLAATGINPQAGVQFATQANPPTPRTLYVAPAGNNSNNGLAPDAAWRTLNHAAGAVRPGDTVVLAEGTWHETVFLRVGGQPGLPVVWQAAPGAKVELNGNDRNLKNGFVLVGKPEIAIDGVYFRGFGMGGVYEGMVSLRDSDNVTLSRCFFDGSGPGYSTGGFHAASSASLLVSNCVVANAFNGAMALRCPDLRIEHTVFLRNLIGALIVVNKPGEKIHLDSSIVVDSLPIKRTVQLFEIPEVGCLVQTNNGFFLRPPEADRPTAFLFYRSAGAMTPGEYFAKFGANDSKLGDPQFAGLAGVEFGPDVFPPDQFMGTADIDFPWLFTTRADWVEQGIGLDPAAFAGFHFQPRQE